MDFSAKVVVKYKYIGPDKKTKRRVSLHDEQMSLQTYEWDTLIDLLRSKVVISDISCSDISDGHGQKASPYVKFTVGPSKQKTSVKANEIHPQWEGLSLTFREAEDKNRKRGSFFVLRPAHVLRRCCETESESILALAFMLGRI